MPSILPAMESVAPALTETVTEKKKLVPLEAHIISKCPDTRDALRELILPAMQQIADKVDFKLTYIGTYVDVILALY